MATEPTAIGRPRAEIDLAKVILLAKDGATQEEIAGVLGVSLRTLTRRFQEEPEIWAAAYETGVAELKVSLRHRQVEAAMAGNPALLIWLGKQLLGQKDKVEHSGSGPGGAIVYSSARELLARRIAGITERNRKGGSS